jgi:predicted MFS family arabinose efflux permease
MALGEMLYALVCMTHTYVRVCSAAAGKLGAVVGAAMMGPLNDAYGTQWVMYVSAAISLLGAAATLLLPSDIDSVQTACE